MCFVWAHDVLVTPLTAHLLLLMSDGVPSESDTVPGLLQFMLDS